MGPFGREGKLCVIFEKVVPSLGLVPLLHRSSLKCSAYHKRVKLTCCFPFCSQLCIGLLSYTLKYEVSSKKPSSFFFHHVSLSNLKTLCLIPQTISVLLSCHFIISFSFKFFSSHKVLFLLLPYKCFKARQGQKRICPTHTHYLLEMLLILVHVGNHIAIFKTDDNRNLLVR